MFEMNDFEDMVNELASLNEFKSKQISKEREK